MADTVSTITLYNDKKRLIVKCMSRSDGTGETNVIKVDKSTFTGLNGLEPSSLAIEQIEWEVNGMEVVISVDRTTDIVLARLTGAGYGCMDYRDVGGLQTKGDSSQTGDILFSTSGHSAGDNYDVTLHLRKKD